MSHCAWRSHIVLLISFLAEINWTSREKFKFDKSLKAYEKKNWHIREDTRLISSEDTDPKEQAGQRELEGDPLTIISLSIVNMHGSLYSAFPENLQIVWEFVQVPEQNQNLMLLPLPVVNRYSQIIMFII